MEFKECRLGDLCDIKIGRTPPRKEKEWFNKNKNDYKWISIKDLGNCVKYIFNTSETITREAREKFNMPIIKTGTVVLSFKLTIGRVAICGEDMLSNEAIAQLPIMDNKILNRDFLYYYLLNYNYDLLGSTSSIATAINSNILKTLIMKLPTLEIQNKIVKILSSLDEKIELNNQINDNLSEISKQLYKRWFIDFDFPNEEGKPYKTSGGKMIDSEIGKIPENWKINNLKDVSTIASGKRPLVKLKSKENDSIPIVGASGIMGFTKDFNFDEDIIITGRVGTLGIVKRYPYKIWASDNTLIISTKSKNYIQNYLNNVDYMSMNRGSTQPLLTQTDMKSLKLVWEENIVNKFERVINPLNNKMEKNRVENKVLIELRDTLLPKLMNGEINLENIEI